MSQRNQISKEHVGADCSKPSGPNGHGKLLFTMLYGGSFLLTCISLSYSVTTILWSLRFHASAVWFSSNEI